MPRLARKNSGTSFFHIIVQGINRKIGEIVKIGKDTVNKIINNK